MNIEYLEAVLANSS